MSEFLTIRFDEQDKDLLRRVCANRREHVSDFVRRVVVAELAKLSYLSPEEKKSLGVLLE